MGRIARMVSIALVGLWVLGGFAAAADTPAAAGVSAEAASQGQAAQPSVKEMPVYNEQLSDRRIGAGETVSYTTISSAFAGLPPTEGFYPGALTVRISGTVVVEAGGCLSIGTLSIGGEEASPELVWDPGATIRVEAGGQLKLTGVTLAGVQDTPVIEQGYGGSVLLQATPVEEGWIAWSGPVVKNLSWQPEDLWLAAGTPLTAAQLPVLGTVELENQGQSQQTDLRLEWDLTGCADQQEGECTVPGQFLDEAGTVLPSLRPLELTVHWYTPEALVVTDGVWKGQATATAQLTVPWLPEEAEVWGEVSTDNGQTWTRWEDEASFFLVEQEPDGYVCVFVLPDDTPRLFRVAAREFWEDRFWQSQAIALAPDGQEDSGGNRGGSVTPVSPQRTPTLPSPTPTPAPTSTPAPTGSPSLAATPAPAAGRAAPKPAALSPAEETPQPTPAAPAGTATPETPAATAAPLPTATPETAAPSHRALPLPGQILLVAAGLALCGVLALAAAGVIRFRRPR